MCSTANKEKPPNEKSEFLEKSEFIPCHSVSFRGNFCVFPWYSVALFVVYFLSTWSGKHPNLLWSGWHPNLLWSRYHPNLLWSRCHLNLLMCKSVSTQKQQANLQPISPNETYQSIKINCISCYNLKISEFVHLHFSSTT